MLSLLLKKRRIVENGDTVVIDFEGFVDGEAFEGGKAKTIHLKSVLAHSFLDLKSN